MKNKAFKHGKALPYGADGKLITLDPLLHYEKKESGWFLDTLGFLPIILLDSAGDNFHDRAVAGYADTAGCPVYWNQKANITEEGIYQYPEDPDLYPVAKFETNDQVAYAYEYGFVACQNESGDWIHARLD